MIIQVKISKEQVEDLCRAKNCSVKTLQKYLEGRVEDMISEEHLEASYTLSDLEFLNG